MSDITRALIAANREALPLPRFISSFFTSRIIRLDNRDIDLQRFLKKARVAQFVNPLADAKGTEQLDYTTLKFRLPTIQDLQTITGEDLEGVMFGDNEYTPTTPESKLVFKLGDVIKEQSEMIDTRVELSAIDIAENGTLTVLGEGENRIIDFGRSATLDVDIGTVDATRYFDDAAADIPEELTAMIVTMGEAGSTVTDIVGRFDIMSLVVGSDDIKGELDTRRYEYGGIVFENRLAQDGVVFHGVYKGCRLWSYSGIYVDEDGADQRAMPDDKLLFFADSNANITAYGYFPDIESLLPNATGIDAARNEKNLITKVSAGNGGAKIEAIQTVAPLLADVTSVAAMKVLA